MREQRVIDFMVFAGAGLLVVVYNWPELTMRGLATLGAVVAACRLGRWLRAARRQDMRDRLL